MKQKLLIVIFCTLCLTPLVNAQSVGYAHPAVVINEIAWAGSASDALDEWIELYNPSAVPINLAGWTLTDGYPLVTFTDAHTIAANGYLLIERHPAATSLTEDAVFDDPASTLSNSGEVLQLLAPDNTRIDQSWRNALAAWPAGASSPRATMARINPTISGTPANWQTSSAVSTALDSGGQPIVGSPSAQNEGRQLGGGLLLLETDGQTSVLEGGDPDHVQIGLGGGAPTAPVKVLITPNNAEIDLGNGAGIAVTLIFTPANALSLQALPIRAVNDTKVEAFHATTLAITTESTDPNFNGHNDAFITVSIADSDALVPSSIIFSEIAWAGTAADPTHEWIELYNPTEQTLSTSNMLIESASGNLRIRLPAIILPPSGFAVLEKTTDDTVLNDLADLRYDYGSLSNLGDTLTLRTEYGELLDTVNLDGGFWGGGTAEPLYRTLERHICPGEAVPLDLEENWGSNTLIQRNGAAANGAPLNGTPRAINSFCTVTEQAFFGNSVVINEVAWAGTSAAAADEWLELHNPTSTPIDVSGYTLTSLTDGSPTIALPAMTIAANGYLLFEIDELATSVAADVVYEKGALYYEGEALALLDATGTIIDTANLSGGPWAGGNSYGYPEFASMERRDPTAPDSSSNWVTNNAVTRNGSDRSGNRINGTPGAANSALFAVGVPRHDVLINELVPIPGSNWAQYGLLLDHTPYEFFELYNPTRDTIDLSNWLVMDANANVYQFPPPYEITPQQLLTIPLAQTGFSLNNNGDCLTLYTPAFGREVDHVCYYDDSVWGNESISRDGAGKWHYDWQPTPSMTNRPTEKDDFANSDFVPPDYTIGALRNLPVESWGRITGQVTVVPNTFGARTIYLQDDTGGIKVYLRGDWPALTSGQTVSVWGKLKAYDANLELYVGDIDQVQLGHAGAELVPPMQTVQALGGLDGQLVTLQGTVVYFTAHTAVIADNTGQVRVFFSGLGERPPDMQKDQTWQFTGVVSRNEDGTQRLTTRTAADAQLHTDVVTTDLYSVGEFNGLPPGARVRFTAQVWRVSANTLVLGNAQANIRVFFADAAFKPVATVGQRYTVSGQTEFVPEGSARTPGQRLTVSRKQDIVYVDDNYAIDYAVPVEVFQTIDEGVGAVLQGEVIALPGDFGARSLFIRDANLRGIRVYLGYGDWPDDVQLGQHMVFYAEKKVFNGEIEAYVPGIDHIRWGGRNPVPQAKLVDTGNFEPASGAGIESDLVTVVGTVIRRTRNTVIIDDGSGPVRIFFGNQTAGRPDDVRLWTTYRATGIVAHVPAGGNAIPGYRLTTRTDADFHPEKAISGVNTPAPAVLGVQLPAQPTAENGTTSQPTPQHPTQPDSFPTQPVLAAPDLVVSSSGTLSKVEPRFLPTADQLERQPVLYNCRPNLLVCTDE